MIYTLILSFLLLLATAGNVYAASPTATPTTEKETQLSSTAETTPKQKQLEDLKERLATKVAQLRQSQRRAIFGTIKSTSVSTITVELQTSDIKIELTDDIQVFQIIKGTRTKLTTEDLAKGDMVSVFGEYDTGLEILRAKVVFIQSPLPQSTAGRITEISEKDFTVTIATPEGQTYILDIERSTKNLLWEPDKGIVKSGFSKLAVGNTVHATGIPVPKKENRLTALRLLDLGQLTETTPTPTKEASTKEASAGATEKPSVTPKPTPKPTATPKATPAP